MTLSKRKARFNSQARDKDGTFTNKNKMKVVTVTMFQKHWIQFL
jgi:hypothetical protein